MGQNVVLRGLSLLFSLAFIPAFASAQDASLFFLSSGLPHSESLSAFSIVKGAPRCTDVLENVDEALAHPRRACEIFITSPGSLAIPRSIYRLIFAESIGIDGPETVQIPRTFWFLRSLRELQIANAGLTELSPRIGRLTKLTVLDLSGNDLHELPSSIENLKNLRVLFLRGNPLSVATIADLQQKLPETRIVIDSPLPR